MNERTVALSQQELWAMQALIKPLVPDNEGTTAVPALMQLEADVKPVPAPLLLRQKVNSALLRIADERPEPKEVTLDLTAEELWMVDSVINREMGDWAQKLLVKVFRALEELQLGIPLISREEDDRRLETGRGGGAEVGA